MGRYDKLSLNELEELRVKYRKAVLWLEAEQNNIVKNNAVVIDNPRQKKKVVLEAKSHHIDYPTPKNEDFSEWKWTDFEVELKRNKKIADSFFTTLINAHATVLDRDHLAEINNYLSDNFEGSHATVMTTFINKLKEYDRKQKNANILEAMKVARGEMNNLKQ